VLGPSPEPVVDFRSLVDFGAGRGNRLSRPASIEMTVRCASEFRRYSLQLLMIDEAYISL
jgi:hypothetical protein